MPHTALKQSVVRFVVDGIGFSLDVSALEPTAQRHYQSVTARGNIYEPVMTRCLTRLLKQAAEPCFMDVGGFAGYYTCYVATLLGPHSRPIHTIESNPAYCRSIRQSCELNGLTNVRVVEGILSDGAEVVTVGKDGFSVDFGAAEAEPGATTTVTLDELREREGVPAPTIVKMDIHGSEGKALFGMTSTLRDMDFLLLELHGHHRLEEYSPGVSRTDIFDLLWRLDLSIYYIAGHRALREQKNRPSIRSGRFVYRRVTPDNVDGLFFDRLGDACLLITQRDVEASLGESISDPYLCYTPA